MKLSEMQQGIVEANMGLVGKVIKDKVHDVSRLGIYTYEDIYQIGCLGLCKAAYTDRGGCFSTYAYRLIWNEICDALIYASRRSSTEQVTDPEVLLMDELQDETASAELKMDLDNALKNAEQSAYGVTAKGIRALRLMADGYTGREIGEQMHASANNVTAWISRARSYLRSCPEIRSLRYPEAVL
ncbi:MAG: sigma-70 family RNA polymerase sigma factor [Oscillospiraceae bacterium]